MITIQVKPRGGGNEKLRNFLDIALVLACFKPNKLDGKLKSIKVLTL